MGHDGDVEVGPNRNRSSMSFHTLVNPRVLESTAARCPLWCFERFEPIPMILHAARLMCLSRFVAGPGARSRQRAVPCGRPLESLCSPGRPRRRMGDRWWRQWAMRMTLSSRPRVIPCGRPLESLCSPGRLWRRMGPPRLWRRRRLPGGPGNGPWWGGACRTDDTHVASAWNYALETTL
jgi:hypothetical protein